MTHAISIYERLNYLSFKDRIPAAIKIFGTFDGSDYLAGDHRREVSQAHDLGLGKGILIGAFLSCALGMVTVAGRPAAPACAPQAIMAPALNQG